MDEKKAQEFLEEFNAGLHRLGRITLIVSVILLVGAPFIIGAVNGVMPDLMGIVEFLVYSPMLGAGGSYLAFITGNVTNMKIPCAINARDIAKTKVGTPENEIISTLSVATSAIVTTLVIVVGVVLMIPLRPVLENPVLVPAFDNVVPALFGALGLKYFSKSPKIAVVPVLFMTLLCVLVPSMISQTSILIIPSGALALAIGYVLFKKGKL